VVILYRFSQRAGGSDVSQTETIATSAGHPNAYGTEYKLDGFKWFSSATDSDVSLALARTGDPKEGSRSLSLFLLPLGLPLLHDRSLPKPSPVSNGILVHRLKSKIGTHALPTAELSINNSTAYLVGPLNQGVKNITPVLNITRLYSGLSSAAYLRKCLAIASAYAKVRTINGGKQLLQNNPIHMAQLASINLLYRAITHLAFGAIRLLGRAECEVATPGELQRLRLLTPVVKAFASEKCCSAMEDSMTTLGGQGYMEEIGIGR
jgi:alkylation response protein AidB-like acyl-CoA dehydrogenase